MSEDVVYSCLPTTASKGAVFFIEVLHST